MPTIAQIITNGEISVPLCANDKAKGNLFGKKLAAPKSPVLIKMVTDALNWAYTGGAQSDQEQTQIANYLVWLYGKFGLQAASISGSGGSVTPITPGSSSASRLDFIVSASSTIATGATSASLPQYQGIEIDFIRGGISQSMVTSESSYIVWVKATASLTISPALGAGELITIIPS